MQMRLPGLSSPPRPAVRAAVAWLSDLANFSRLVMGCPLRAYQLEPARAVLASILSGAGRTFAIQMARQAGKNELSAQLEAYLLNLYQRRGGQIVKASPTFKPQTVNSILRLCDRLDNRWNRGRWRRREGYIVELGRARAMFFSAEPQANVVGATANLLLEADEVQDVAHDKWNKDFRPMAASTNATTVLYGTAWTSETLLAQTIEALERAEAGDGIRRTFTYDAAQVADEVPAYGEYVRAEVARLGRDHPLIKTQYYLETIDAQAGLFPPRRRALMRGDHERRYEPVPGRRYALLVDVAGEDSGASAGPVQRSFLANPRRDATALTVVDVDASLQSGHRTGSPLRSTPPAVSVWVANEPAVGDRHARIASPTLHGRGFPTYRVVDRGLWLGTPHAQLHGQILAFARHWRALWVVIDATGVGAGLASFLDQALPGKVLPVTFSPKVKSDLGWAFVGVVETGRFQDYASGGEADEEPETRQFWYEVAACEFEVRPGPSQQMRWGVWEPPAYDGWIARGHDDLLISAALCAVLDKQAALGTGASATVAVADALDDIDHAEW